MVQYEEKEKKIWKYGKRLYGKIICSMLYCIDEKIKKMKRYVVRVHTRGGVHSGLCIQVSCVEFVAQGQGQ